jgi:hypothetical protein
VFVSTFYATREALGSACQNPFLEYFCDALIREKDKLMKLGVMRIASTSKKSLVARQKDKSKNPKKQHPFQNKKQNKGLKPSQSASTPNGDKEEKSKSKKID